MQIITAPSKTQVLAPHCFLKYSQPLFLKQTQALINKLTTFSMGEIKTLMKTSDKLTQSTHHKIHSFSRPFTSENSRPALFTFQGDAYSSIDAESYTESQLLFAQETLYILSGLYGILRPLDLMQPYRLEMGAKLQVDQHKNLYQFWRETITETIRQSLEKQEDPNLINLASTEYSKVVTDKHLPNRMVSIVFKQNSKGHYKTIPIHSKRARGMMIHYTIVNTLKNSEGLKDFNMDGYLYSKQDSTTSTWVFLQSE